MELVELLIKHGSNINATDNYENTPLHLSAEGFDFFYELSLCGKQQKNQQKY